jgi:hypothetical protein
MYRVSAGARRLRDFGASTAGADVAHPAAIGCFASPSTELDVPFTIALSVRPAESEAMLYATLYGASDCSDAPIQSRLIAVRPPAINIIDGGATQGGGQ